MKRVRVVVTAEDIEKGRRTLSDKCPLARAVRRAGYDEALVWSTYWSPDGGRTADLPAAAQRFVGAFDAKFPVKPATFLLPLPETT